MSDLETSTEPLSEDSMAAEMGQVFDAAPSESSTEAPQETVDQTIERVGNEVEAREAEMPAAIKAWGLDAKHWASTPQEVRQRIAELQSLQGRNGNELGSLRKSAADLNAVVSKYELMNADGSPVSLAPVLEESLM